MYHIRSTAEGGWRSSADPLLTILSSKVDLSSKRIVHPAAQLPTRCRTILSSKVNLPHAINFRAVYGAHLVMLISNFWRERNPRAPSSETTNKVPLGPFCQRILLKSFKVVFGCALRFQVWALVGDDRGASSVENERTLHPTPCTLHPAPCTLHPAPCTLHSAPQTSIPCTLHSADAVPDRGEDILRPPFSGPELSRMKIGRPQLSR